MQARAQDQVADPAVEATLLAGSAADADLSIIALLLNADIVVKVVIVILVLSSVWCWAIIFEKFTRLRRLAAQSDLFEESFWSGGGSADGGLVRTGSGIASGCLRFATAASLYASVFGTSLMTARPPHMSPEIVQ